MQLSVTTKVISSFLLKRRQRSPVRKGSRVREQWSAGQAKRQQPPKPREILSACRRLRQGLLKFRRKPRCCAKCQQTLDLCLQCIEHFQRSAWRQVIQI